MEMRDRLIELFRKIEYTPFPEMTMKSNLGNQFTDYALNCIADELLANGVIVQEWISVKDRLPEKHGDYLTYDQRYKDIEIYYYMGWDEWDHHRNGITDAEGHGFTHWTPLPNPPKEGAEKALKEREGNG